MGPDAHPDGRGGRAHDARVVDPRSRGTLLSIGVTEQSTAINPATGARYAPRANYVYRAVSEYRDDTASPNNWNASVSYVPGSHNVKIGYSGSFTEVHNGRVPNHTQLRYTFNNQVPISVSYFLAPRWDQHDRTMTTGLYAQDQWSMGNLTLNLGVRYDRYRAWLPAQDLPDLSQGRAAPQHRGRGRVPEPVRATCGALAEAVKAVRGAGLEVRNALCVVDREEGGADALARRGARLVPLFRAGELLPA